MTDPPGEDQISVEVRAILEAERRRPEPASDVQQRIRGGAERAIRRAGDPPNTTNGVSIGSRAAWLLGGMVLGALLHALWTSTPDERAEQSPRPVVTTEARPVESPIEPNLQAPPVETTPESPVAEPDEDPGTETETAPRPRRRPGGDVLEQERLLIEEARVALRERRFSDAIATSRRHAQSFPRGNLAEEALALEARALLRAGRVSEARPRVAEFTERFPHSFHRASLEREIATETTSEQ